MEGTSTLSDRTRLPDDDPGGGTRPAGRKLDVAAGFAVSFGALVLLTATLGDYGMAWDEGFTVEREERLIEWFARVAGDSSAEWAWSPVMTKLERRSEYLRRAGVDAVSPWSRESLRFYWPFAREEPNGHPPFYALLGLAGWSVARYALPPPESYRFGPAALFALTLGVVCTQMARWYGGVAGWTSALGLLTMPRVFAHAHLASYDVPTLCFWILAVLAFSRAVEPSAEEDAGKRAWFWTAAFGLFLGCGMATKLTGWFMPVPILAWSLFYRDVRALRTLLLGGLLAGFVVYATNPAWWTEPYQGLHAFFRSNLTRHELRPIPTLFLGRLYRFSLPWYNTLLWTVVTVPPATLVVALMGVGRVLAARLSDRPGTLLLACWAFLLILKALPNAPGHDSERLFLAAFAFLACLAGIGAAAIATWLRSVLPAATATSLTALALIGVVGSGAWSTWRFHPLQLSYYNRFIGGLSGAARAGLEPTYYWDALTPDVREWLNSHTDAGETIGFDLPAVTFEYLHRWGRLKPSPLTPRDEKPRWFVVMNRPGHLDYLPGKLGRILLENARPALVKTVDSAPDVPLVAVFDRAAASAAEEIRSQQPATPPPAP